MKQIFKASLIWWPSIQPWWSKLIFFEDNNVELYNCFLRSGSNLQPLCCFQQKQPWLTCWPTSWDCDRPSSKNIHGIRYDRIFKYFFRFLNHTIHVVSLKRSIPAFFYGCKPVWAIYGTWKETGLHPKWKAWTNLLKGNFGPNKRGVNL